MSSGRLSVEGVDGLKVTFSSSYPVMSAKSKWKGLQQGNGGKYNKADKSNSYLVYM